MAELPEQLRSGLADRYRIEREVGRGGMATVYLARDLRNRRPVALKVLHQELSYAVGADRFLREIEVAANLTHPHILPLHDSGEIAGLLYYVMPYVDGESLRDRLNREVHLPVEEALRITREVADALAYAHAHGVIHRDVKPENILLSAGHALVADFGIARALGQAGAEKLTETGMAVGTAAYMSPEQASGERQLDGRSDIYSLGCVLYEMLAGEPPYTGPTAQAIIAKRFSETVPRVRRVRPSVPDSVEHAITRALAPVAADRFATAADFVRVLAAAAVSPTTSAATPILARSTTARSRHRMLALIWVTALGLIAAAGGLLWQRSHRGGDPGGPIRLAVLPFENQGAQEDEYFADGMTDAVRGKLSALPALQVIARHSSTEYKKSTKTLKEIGRELGVQYLLTATVRWEKRSAASRVQVSPELVQVSTGSTRWQQPFGASLTDVFQVQGQIAGQVAEALDVALGAKEKRTLADKPTENLAAYDAYLRGEAVWQSTDGSVRSFLEAMHHFERAVALDSAFAPAMTRLVQVQAVFLGNDPAEAQRAGVTPDRVRWAADRVVALGRERANGHLALGYYFGLVERDNSRALAEFTLGLGSAPNHPELLRAASYAEGGLGRWNDALTHVQQSAALDPRSRETLLRLCNMLLWMRRYDEAGNAFKLMEQRFSLASPGFLKLRTMLEVAKGDSSSARAVLHRAPKGVSPADLAIAFVTSDEYLGWLLDETQQQLVLRLKPNAFDNRLLWATALARTYHVQGNLPRAAAYADSARVAADSALREAPEDEELHALLGLALAQLGRRAEAMEAGERAMGMMPVSRDHETGPYRQHQLVRIYLLVDEPEKALDQLEPLLKIPYYLSPGWLQIDPDFAPLRGNPRFQRLVKGP